jgi:hypothetical protein
VVGTFFLVTAARAIIAEYAKRFWFRRGFLDAFARLERNLTRAQAGQALMREESARIKPILERLITENERLHAELILACLRLSAHEREQSRPESGTA